MGVFCSAPCGVRFVCAPWARSRRWKSWTCPGSGKDTAKTKDVLFIEILWLTWGESEGRWRQISGLTNRNHIRLQLRIRLHDKLKSNNYSELTVVNVADMKGLLKTTDEWARRRIRAVYWKAKELANSRKDYWRMAKVLNQIFSNKIIAKLGYTSMFDYYLVVYEN